MTGATSRGLRAGLAVLLLGGAGTLAAPAVAGAAPATGQVYLVQGLVGTAVAVELDGRQVAAAAPSTAIVGPLEVPAGQHVLALRSGGRTVTNARFAVVAGRSLDLVAQRAADAARTPRLVVFRNDLTPVGPGRARLAVAHAAVAPPADVTVAGSVLFRDVASGESLSLLVPAGAHPVGYPVGVAASVGGATVLAPVTVPVRAGTLTRVFAVGDPASGTADAVVQVLPLAVTGANRPSSVPTGDGGQTADEFVPDRGPAPPLALVAAGLAALLLLRGPVRRALRRRRAR